MNTSTGICLCLSALVISFGIACNKGSTPAVHNSPPDAKPLIANDLADSELDLLTAAATANPGDKSKQQALADYLLNTGAMEKAITPLTAILHIDPSDVDSQLKLGGIYLAERRYPEAEAVYRSASTKSANPIAMQGLCATLIKERRFFEARQVGDRALAMQPNDKGSKLLHATAELDFALQFSDPRAHQALIHSAIDELNTLTKSLRVSGDIYFQLGRAAQALFHREESLQYLEKAHQMMPDSGDVARALANSYRVMGHDDLALKMLEEFSKKHPESAAANDMLGQLLVSSRQPGALSDAIAAYTRAYKANQKDSNVCEHLGAAFEKAQDLPRARLLYERATQLNPYHAYAFQKLALVYTRLGEPKLARQASDCADKMAFNEQQLKTILELSSKHPSDVNLHLIIAERYRDMKQVVAAREEYLLVLQQDPGNKRVPKEIVTGAAGSDRQVH